MLVVLNVKSLEDLNINDIEAGKEVTVKGIAESLYFQDQYLESLEKKAALYDEMIEDERERTEIRKERKDSIKKSKEFFETIKEVSKEN